jgi:hypothetical protein
MKILKNEPKPYKLSRLIENLGVGECIEVGKYTTETQRNAVSLCSYYAKKALRISGVIKKFETHGDNGVLKIWREK